VLEGEPGIDVSSARWSHNQVHVDGFWDPLADPPNQVLARHGLAPADLALRPISSLDPQMVIRHARQTLQPPATVALSLTGGTLRAAGTAPRRWIEQTRLLSHAVQGVARLDDADLRSQEDLDALRERIDAFEEVELRFAIGSARPPSLHHAAALGHAAIAAAARARVPICITLTGYADPPGTPDFNRALSQARADRVAAALTDHGLPAQLLHPVAGGVQTTRTVTFRVSEDSGRCPPEAP
jgi:OOP family OmpA-OmpF porin